MFQIQTVCFDNLGLLLAASLNMLLKNNQRYFFFLTLISLSVNRGNDVNILYNSCEFSYMT